MGATIAVTKERRAGETRVAATPETVKKLIALGFDVVVETGAGRARRHPRRRLRGRRRDRSPRPPPRRSPGADILFKVRAPDGRGDQRAEARRHRRRPCSTRTGQGHGRRRWPRRGATAFAMEFVPRITRAQVMDVLSSPGQPRRLPRGDRGGPRLWPGLADDDDRGRHRRRRPRSSSWASASPGCRPSPPPAAWARWSPPPTCAPPPRNRSRAWAPSSSPSRTRSSRTPRPPAGYAKEMRAEYQAKQAALVAEPHQEAGHRHHHRPDPRPPGAAAGHRPRRWPR